LAQENEKGEAGTNNNWAGLTGRRRQQAEGSRDESGTGRDLLKTRRGSPRDRPRAERRWAGARSYIVRGDCENDTRAYQKSFQKL